MGDAERGETALRRAVRSLYEAIGPMKTKWCTCIASAENPDTVYVWVMGERDLEKVPAEWEGFPVVARVSGPFRLL